MYTKSILASALLATCVAATQHEVVAVSPAYTPPMAHAPPPAVHTPPPAAHVAPPMANVHKQEQWKDAPPVAPPAAPPVAAKPPPPPANNVKGAEHQQLTVHLVAVGDNNGSLKYFPDTVHAMPGEVVQFQFHPKVSSCPTRPANSVANRVQNHTVTDSTFDAPCVRKDASLATPQRPGLRSGFIPVTGTEPTTPVYNVLINDTDPIWIFCGQGPHCQRGMSMVINPPNNPERTIQKYQEAAAALPIPSPPAGGPPAGGPPPAAGSPPAGGAAPPPASPPAEATPPASPPAAAEPPSPAVPETPAAASADTSADAAPATFTGAASKTAASSFGLGALLLGVVALL
jgi:hypothetical protein